MNGFQEGEHICANHAEKLVACKRVKIVIGTVDIEWYSMIVIVLVTHIVHRVLCLCVNANVVVDE